MLQEYPNLYNFSSLDVQSKMEESSLRCKELEDEIAALELEKQVSSFSIISVQHFPFFDLFFEKNV